MLNISLLSAIIPIETNFACTQWTVYEMSSDMSTSFCIANGIKQGGIISPMLLISRDQDDDLRLLLKCSGIEGYIGTSFNNYLCYGDDLYLISLSSSVMPHLINICNQYSSTHKLLYNGSNLFALFFRKKFLRIK